MKSAVCVYVRNEQDTIQEWIAYNFVIGFDTVIVMDNLSEDETLVRAERCRVIGDVRVATWPDTSPDAQRKCYNHVLSFYGAEFDWIAFIDSDEFIVPIRDRTIRAFLETIPGHGAIGLNWALFGANGHEAIPAGLVVENFTQRAEDSFGPNLHVKSIVRPSRTVSCAHPHLFHLDDERWGEDGRYCSDYVDAAGKPLTWGPEPGLTVGLPDLSICRVNHYFTRSREHWNRKMLRKWRDIERPYEAFDFHNRNEVCDQTAASYAPELKDVLRQLD